jgi:hypothetical protein
MEIFLSGANGSSGVVEVHFQKESILSILSVWRIAIKQAEPGDLQSGESLLGSWTSLPG